MYLNNKVPPLASSLTVALYVAEVMDAMYGDTDTRLNVPNNPQNG